MNALIILVGIAICLYLFRGRIEKFILSRRKPQNETGILQDKNIFVPSTHKRTFNFSIEIEDVGEGKAKLTILK